MRERTSAKTGGGLVCVKIFHSDDHASALTQQNEIRMMRRMRHPNLIRFIDTFPFERQQAIVMAFCSGGDLRAFLRALHNQMQVLTENRVWYWFLQLTLALQYLHDTQRVLHRDIKTANIFLDDEGFLVLGDLGIARDDAKASTVVGTPLYMAPELWDTPSPTATYGAASDLWALGCVLYEICAGHAPFAHAKSMPTMIRAICSGRFSPLPAKWSPRLRHVITELLSVDPMKRPTANDLLRRSENFPYLRRYLQDRQRLATRFSAAKEAAGQPDYEVLIEQVRGLGVDIEQLQRTERPISTTATIASHVAEQAPLSYEDEAIELRHAQLRLALERLKAMRVDHVVVSRSSPASYHDSIASTTQPWREPVQVRPESAAGIKKQPVSRSAQHSSVGALRLGVPLTEQAKRFSAKRPICTDVRDLRKQANARAAERYRQRLDEQFNSTSRSPVRGNAAAHHEQLRPREERRKASASGVQTMGTTVDSGENDDGDGDGALERCIAALEDALRLRLAGDQRI
ncbi:hypothetical protein PINS_up015385 [Pythium insidiosum]|nr:hypothetical protein PINS_up015385 [Pythium insidiosum]